EGQAEHRSPPGAAGGFDDLGRRDAVPGAELVVVAPPAGVGQPRSLLAQPVDVPRPEAGSQRAAQRPTNLGTDPSRSACTAARASSLARVMRWLSHSSASWSARVLSSDARSARTWARTPSGALAASSPASARARSSTSPAGTTS